LAEELQPPNSLMGKYFVQLKLGPYSRPTPFKKSDWVPKEHFYFPLPDNLGDFSSISYSTDSMGSVADLFNRDASGTVRGIALRNSGKVVTGIASAISSGVSKAIGDNALGKMYDGAADMLGKAFPAEGITSAIEQSLGIAPNPNPAVLFQGPNLRDFNLSWAFYPKNATESENLRHVIKMLKRAALPSNTWSGSASVLNYPWICQLNFFPWDQQGKGDWGWSENSIIRIKKCMIASVNVNYNPSNVPGFFHGSHQPIMTTISMNFKEIEYMLSDDWSDDWEAAANGDRGSASGLGNKLNSLPSGIADDNLSKAVT
jgi:hypothetical protein